MFEGVSEIASRVAELKSALDSYSPPPAPASVSDPGSFQQTLQNAQSAPSLAPGGQPSTGDFLSPNPVSSSQLASQPVSVGSSGGTQLPPSASMLGSAAGGAGLSGLAGLTGGSGASALAGLTGGGGASALAGLTGGSGASALAGLTGASGASGLAGLLGTGGASSLSGLAGLTGGAGMSGLAALGSLGGSDLTGGLGGLPAGTSPANLASLASLEAESSGLGSLDDPSGASDSSGGASSSDTGLASLLGGLGQSFAPQAPASALPLQNLVGQIAQSQGVNPALAEAVAQSESGFNPQAVSAAGAQGLMQLMPGTFQRYAQQAGTPGAPSGLPVAGAKLTQPFGPTSQTMEPPLDWNGTHYAHFHTGVDLAVPQGTPIRATMAGTIQIRSDPSGFGNLIVLENGPWDILLGHTSGHPSNIQTGTVVKPGQVVGFAGSTGNSTGPHLHYEVRYNGSITDPTPFLNGVPPSSPSPMDPVANAQAGVGYLKDMLARFNNNVPAALAAYNAGPGAVDKYGGVPPYPETQNYVQKTLQNARDLSA